MNTIKKICLLTSLLFPLAAHGAEGGLSRDMADAEFLVVIPGKIDSYDRASVVNSAFGELTERLTAGQFSGSISMDSMSLDGYVDSVESTSDGIAVQFNKKDVMKLFQDRQIGVYLGTPPDVLLWILWEDPDGTRRILSDSDSNGFIAALKERAKFYGQSVFFPMMDSDDMAAVSPDTIDSRHMEDIAAASGRYGTRYIAVGVKNGTGLYWELFEVSKMASPVYQSTTSGEPFEIGKMMSQGMVYHFAKGKTEKIHGIRGASAPASSRVGLIGAAVGKNKVYVVIAGRMSYPEMLTVEKKLRQVQGLTKASLYQTQADQNVYEIIYNGNYDELKAGIKRIAGIKQLDASMPYNFDYDIAYAQEREEQERLEKEKAQALAAEAAAQKPTEGISENGKSENGEGESGAEGKESAAAPETQAKPAEEAGGVKKMQAIPITDPDSIIDTSNERL